MNIQTGDILICRGNSWISKAIMAITKSKWSHACIIAETWGQIGVIEAQSNGVNFKLLETWKSKWGYHYEVFRFVEEFDQKELMIKAFEKCGETKYDWFTFFRRGFGYRKERNEKKEDKRMICSEFVAYVWDIPEGYDITPSELHVYLSNNNKFIKL